ncbi:cytochrome C oxidase Cbb3 [Agarivorans sp. B2Z047]|uniref:1-acyl-sn-glycerol-3-phosphate acyltransferase n=1 Tax=Agarivorans sp. B2Z047 TaxID=2652721 RepID=UPI00128D6250|nr:1-acyl-sn-glycerol-3-phosphate acyltransferase [Agarivorans sp. B2Z047]MPW31179.1 cytochrome C oxidase Cbb3 [Agarivorans sp. B2Z047]UQN42852.1 1-acyl-sn-glycerol-3-phosphate acyltransferase [Agarivorans sp. B2Z047]
MSQFDSIRPYQDSEVKSTLQRLINDPEFITTLIKFRYPKASGAFLSLTSFALRQVLKFKVRNVKSVYDFQVMVERYMAHMIKTTTSQLSSSGLDSLDLSKPHLFISNHRDIALDPAFVNYLLHINGQDTVQIAIGDNLLSKPWVSDLMRLNRSFIVKRSASAKREKLANLKELSAYIQHTLASTGDHIWIAQREGRAKDGLDLTNSALISMLALNKPKQQEFADYIKELNIVPVSISYEFDPCDVAKANELVSQNQHGEYQKEEHEDIYSISRGIVGQKGRVHVHFAEPLAGEYENAKDVAEALDKAIIGNYQLMPTNWIALGDAIPEEIPANELAEAKRYFEAKTRDISAEVRSQLFEMYANPIRARQQLSE